MQLRNALLRSFPSLAKLPSDAFLVGGAIRDLLLGNDPADADVACADPLGCARAIGGKVIRLGKDELTAYRVVQGEHVYDFAPLLGNSIDRDLARRDFTINAMAVPLRDSDELLDPHHGRDDLDARLVRMVDARNFNDDPLRILKAVRLAVRYRFLIEPATMRAMQERAAAITTVAAERVFTELAAIFSANDFRKAVALLHESGLDAPLGLNTATFHTDDVPLAAALALLVDKPKKAAERWRWPEALLRDVLELRRLATDHSLVALYDAGEPVARQLPAYLRALGVDAHVPMPDFSTAPLLTGEEIAALTALRPGPELGRIKRAMLEAQVRGEVRTREEAERFVWSAAAMPPL
jgi:Probable RNA and SrmB- binding site of polymerase A/Poly A polymerase head domain